jgi:hypothetical protein
MLFEAGAEMISVVAVAGLLLPDFSDSSVPIIFVSFAAIMYIFVFIIDNTLGLNPSIFVPENI